MNINLISEKMTNINVSILKKISAPKEMIEFFFRGDFNTTLSEEDFFFFFKKQGLTPSAYEKIGRRFYDQFSGEQVESYYMMSIFRSLNELLAVVAKEDYRRTVIVERDGMPYGGDYDNIFIVKLEKNKRKQK